MFNGRRMNQEIAALLDLSHELGREERQLAILSEGNASARLDGGQFALKARGARMASLVESDLTVCRGAPMIELLDRKTLPDATIEKALLDARVDFAAQMPGLDSIFHAWLLTLENVRFVGQAHPVAVNQILASPRARDFAEHRMFPDEILFCGAMSVYVPYADPGLPLAWQIRERTRDFIREHGMAPRLILLQNHGIVALGASAPGVLATVMMANKAALIFSGAAAMGGPTFLLPQHVDRILARPDEGHRQRLVDF